MTANQMDAWAHARRIGGLRRFGLAITIFNILGHTVLGFEQSWAQPLVSLATTYSCELFCEWMEARAEGRRPRFLGSWREFVDFLLPAHITGLAVAMLLYSGDRLLPTVLAAAVAIASKNTLRLKVNGRVRHFLNPSNFGITVTLLLFPWVGIAPPYHFTENLGGAWYWIVPAIICVSGSAVNQRFTGRLPLIAAWWGGFVTQAALRNLLFGSSFIAALNPMTGVAFVLFSFYMVTDPATTPFDKKSQVLFGLSVATVYGALVSLHVAFGLFFALTTVSGLRGLAQYVESFNRNAYPQKVPVPATAVLRKTA
jgi:enediyne biosynthesis protein E5